MAKEFGPRRGAFRPLAVAIALALALGEAFPAAATVVDVDFRQDGDAIVIEAHASLAADAATAWGVLTDYDRYADFIPGLRSSRVIARRGDSLTVAQSTDAAPWPLRMPVRVTYKITESPPYRLRSTAAASLLHTLDSSYRLTPVASGVRIDYTGRLASRPLLFRLFELRAVEARVVDDFQALADEIERGAAAGR